MKKMCTSVSDFYMKIINNKHTLLYILPTIHSIQRYYDLCELTNCFTNYAVSAKSVKHLQNKAKMEKPLEIINLNLIAAPKI